MSGYDREFRNFVHQIIKSAWCREVRRDIADMEKYRQAYLSAVSVCREKVRLIKIEMLEIRMHLDSL